MVRDPRVHVQEAPLMEFTNRVFQGHHIIDTDEFFNLLVVGILVMAQRLFPMKLHAGVIAKNHFHLLGSPQNVAEQSGFLGYFTRELSKLVKRRYPEWEDSVFRGRYKAFEISDEVEAQCSRLHYFLSNMCKEGLVASPLDWPGVPFARTLIEGGVLKGLVIDREALAAARARGEDVTAKDFAEEVELVLEPLPCFAHLSDQDYRELMTGMVRQVEAETASMHAVDGNGPLGAEGVQAVDPMRRKKLTIEQKAPRPKVYAFAKEIRKMLEEGLRRVVADYREAAAQLRRGNLRVRFPPNCFPPSLPFVPREALSTTSLGYQGPPQGL